MTECTFQPAVHIPERLSKPLSHDTKPVYLRLSEDAEKLRDLQIKREELKLIEELKGATFAPTIPARSRASSVRRDSTLLTPTMAEDAHAMPTKAEEAHATPASPSHKAPITPVSSKSTPVKTKPSVTSPQERSKHHDGTDRVVAAVNAILSSPTPTAPTAKPSQSPAPAPSTNTGIKKAATSNSKPTPAKTATTASVPATAPPATSHIPPPPSSPVITPTTGAPTTASTDVNGEDEQEF